MSEEMKKKMQERQLRFGPVDDIDNNIGKKRFKKSSIFDTEEVNDLILNKQTFILNLFTKICKLKKV